MLDLMPKISEKFDQLGGVEKYVEKYGKAEIQFFAKEEKPHNIDFSVAIEKLCSMYKMKEITVHPPLVNYFDIETILMYDEQIARNMLEQLVSLSENLNIKLNIIFHTHWALILHRFSTIDKIKYLLKIIEGTNVKILMENLFLITEPFDEISALSICKEIDHPNLRMCFDICHMYCQTNMYKTNIDSWMEKKLNKEDCEKYIYQIHFSYTANNDGYIDKKNTHGVGHPTEELLLKDYKLLEKYGVANKQIVTEIAEYDYSYRKSQIQDIEWLEKNCL